LTLSGGLAGSQQEIRQGGLVTCPRLLTLWGLKRVFPTGGNVVKIRKGGILVHHIFCTLGPWGHTTRVPQGAVVNLPAVIALSGFNGVSH